MDPSRDRDARVERALDTLTSNNQRLQRMRTLFPGIVKILLIIGLALLSWVSTYSGMLELIIANTGELETIYRVAIGFAVAMLMLMIIYLLDALFSPISWGLKTIYAFGYVFLTLISVGFGFGFYWKFLESRAEATRSAEAAITHVQGELQKGFTRLDQLQSTLDTLTAMSLRKARDERARGNTCPNSRPGDGPRRRLRDADATNFAFVSEFIKDRSKTVKGELDGLSGDIAKVLTKDRSTFDSTSGTRNTFMRALNRKLDLTVTRFNALSSDPQLVEHRTNLAERSEKTVFTSGGTTFSCPDVQLQTALRGVVKAIDSLPQIEKQQIAAVEGSEAIVEAFRRLTTTAIGAMQFKLPPSPEELRARQKEAIKAADRRPVATAAPNAQEAGLGTRDYIPLFIALFVDLCILLVSINRPINRFQMLLTLVHEAKDGPIAEILEKFHDTHMGGLRQEFEIFQHVVFDFLGDYYVAVPLSVNRVDARYLANLLVSLEGKGIVDRVMLPPNFMVRRKLAKQNSSFAGESHFRLYRFRDGAWSKLVLDAILGTDAPATLDSAQSSFDVGGGIEFPGQKPAADGTQAPQSHDETEDNLLALPQPGTQPGRRKGSA